MSEKELIEAYDRLVTRAIDLARVSLKWSDHYSVDRDQYARVSVSGNAAVLRWLAGDEYIYEDDFEFDRRLLTADEVEVQAWKDQVVREREEDTRRRTAQYLAEREIEERALLAKLKRKYETDALTG